METKRRKRYERHERVCVCGPSCPRAGLRLRGVPKDMDYRDKDYTDKDYMSYPGSPTALRRAARRLEVEGNGAFAWRVARTLRESAAEVERG
jgi:hypothetical protein